MMVAFVLGEVVKAQSNQAEVGTGVFGSFVLCGLFFIVRVAKEKKTSILFGEAILLISFFSFGYLRMKAESEKSPADYLAEQRKTVTVEGTVYKIGKTAYYCQYYLKDTILICETGEQVSVGAVQVSVKAEEKPFKTQENRVRIGNRVCAQGVCELPKHATNPGNFDWYLYYRALGIHYQLKTNQISIVNGRTDWLKEGLLSLKERIRIVFETICTEKDYGIFCAVLLGEKQELDAEVKSLYEENGISHILAISGLHISLIGMGIYHFSRKRFGFIPSQLIAGLIMAFYVIMTGAGVSSIRAYAMFCLLLTAATLGRTYDLAVSAGWIALILLIRNPYLIYYAGFLLSFGAIVGIGVVGSILNEYVESKNFAVQSIISSMSVIWVTLPVSAYFFFTYATWSILLNLAVIPCMTFVMLSGIFGGIAGMCVPALGMLGIGMGHYILCLYEKICILAEQLPSHQILIGRPKEGQMILYYGMVSTVCVWIKLQNRKKRSHLSEDTKKQNEKNWLISGMEQTRKIIFLFGMMLLFLMVLCYRSSGKLDVTFLDVSQGDGIFLRLPSKATCLIDGGSTDIKKVGEYRILPFLQSERVNCLDFVFVSHMDYDHISGIKEIYESGECRIKTLCLPDIEKPDEAYTNLVQEAEAAGSQILYFSAGDQISEEGLSIRCLHPKAKLVWTDRNSYSMVLWLQYGEIDFLFTGDIGEEQEKELLSSLPEEIEILKAAHHGSQYSNCSAFLQQIAMEYTIISCGTENSYGHPHQEAVERILEAGSQIFVTRDMGAIRVSSDGKTYKIETYLH